MKKVEKLFQKWLDSKNLTRIGYRYYDVVNWDGAEPEERFYSELKLKEAFIAGFNTDKWHYPSKGEYPPEEQEYFVAFKTDKEIYYDVRVLNPDLNNLLLGIGEKIYAWQYIMPPKEEA